MRRAKASSERRSQRRRRTARMQHEVLLALVGCTGELIRREGDRFRLAKDLPFVDASDRVRPCFPLPRTRTHTVDVEARLLSALHRTKSRRFCRWASAHTPSRRLWTAQ